MDTFNKLYYVELCIGGENSALDDAASQKAPSQSLLFDFEVHSMIYPPDYFRHRLL